MLVSRIDTTGRSPQLAGWVRRRWPAGSRPLFVVWSKAEKALVLLYVASWGIACGETNGDSQSAALDEVPLPAPAQHVQSWRISAQPIMSMAADPSIGVDFFRIAAALQLEDGRVIVGDGGQRLLFFGPDGEFRKRVGRRGRGPGEFENIGWLALQRGSLIVYDQRLIRASVYTDAGEFVRLVSLVAPAGHRATPEMIGAFGDGSFLAWVRLRAAPPQGGVGLVRPNALLTRHDSTGAYIDSIAVVLGTEIAIVQGVVAQPVFARNTLFAVGPSGFYVSNNETFAVDAFSVDGTLVRTIKMTHKPIPITEGDLLRAVPAGGPEIPTPPFFPAIASLIVDDVGRIWVEQFTQDSTQPATWFVFDEAGTQVAEVEFDGRLRPTHIGAGFVLGVWRDSLDVEHVRMYTLIR